MGAASDLASDAREALRTANLPLALELLQAQVREHPADARLRTFLFQLLTLMGQWDRALKQLSLVGEIDASTLPMVRTYQDAIKCEALREQVLAGLKVPLLLGEPEAWSALLIEALLHQGRGDAASAVRLREQALEQAPAIPGSVNGVRFEWMADADSRIGPMLEAVMQGRYYWIPFTRLSRIKIEAPEDLRDMVWTAAELEFSHGGEAVALLPTRYAGTPLSDGTLAMARRTEWAEGPPGQYAGIGQRLFTTPDGDIPIMDLREVIFDSLSAKADV